MGVVKDRTRKSKNDSRPRLWLGSKTSCINERQPV